jgi:methionine sulfoxide reductase heme-binding subunit
MAGLTGLTLAATSSELALRYVQTMVMPMARGAMARGAIDRTVLWYLTRTTAVAAYVALTFSVVLGMLRTIARTAGEHLSWVVDELHTFIATLTGLLVVGHMLTIRLDTLIPFSTTNLLWVGDQPYRPMAVNLGVFSFYTLVMLLLTSWLRPRMSYRFWRRIHYLSFVAFALVTAHGWLAGSDATEPWMRTVYASAVGVVGFLMLMRLMSYKRPSAQSA